MGTTQTTQKNDRDGYRRTPVPERDDRHPQPSVSTSKGRPEAPAKGR